MSVFRSLMMRGNVMGNVIYNGAISSNKYLKVPLKVGNTFTTELKIIKDITYSSSDSRVYFGMYIGTSDSLKMIVLSGTYGMFRPSIGFYVDDISICSFTASGGGGSSSGSAKGLTAGSVLKFTVTVISASLISVSLWLNDTLMHRDKSMSINSGDMLYYIGGNDTYIGNVNITRS